MSDQSYKSSTLYNGKDGFVARLEEAMSWDTAAKQLSAEKGIHETKPFKGISERETNLVQRIAGQTFKDTNTSEYRTQERINTVLREQAQRLQEDLAAQKKYLKDLKGYLE